MKYAFLLYSEPAAAPDWDSPEMMAEMQECGVLAGAEDRAVAGAVHQKLRVEDLLSRRQDQGPAIFWCCQHSGISSIKAWSAMPTATCNGR